MKERPHICVCVQLFVAVCVVHVCVNVFCIYECLCVSFAAPAARVRIFPSWLVCVLYKPMRVDVTVMHA